MTKKVSFIVDGFNVYHSTREIEVDTGNKVKWLDLRSLLSSLVPNIGPDIVMADIWYFTAFATHLNDPGVIQRHKTYIQCLESTGVHCEIGKFKPKDVLCPICKTTFVRHEEKETDVAIGVKLQELCINNKCDIAVLVTGDTDLLSAIRSVRRLCPDKKLYAFFPYGRKNKEFAQAVDGSFKIKVDRYVNHQFPTQFVLADGTQLFRPASW
ncbi:MAG: NYN domain-containing protein [Dehalococcoidales bacterium]|nr:NYN domain-containing protein [Dehalococcoidales bacterium]